MPEAPPAPQKIEPRPVCASDPAKWAPETRLNRYSNRHYLVLAMGLYRTQSPDFVPLLLRHRHCRARLIANLHCFHGTSPVGSVYRAANPATENCLVPVTSSRS